MVSLIDDHQLEWPVHAVSATERLEGQKRNLNTGTPRLIPPHVAQCGWGDYDATSKLPSDGKRDECLSHSDFVREQRSTKLVDRGPKPLSCGPLMRVQRYGAESARRIATIIDARFASGLRFCEVRPRNQLLELISAEDFYRPFHSNRGSTSLSQTP